jgi:outer membrane protein assembly factor BamB
MGHIDWGRRPPAIKLEGNRMSKLLPLAAIVASCLTANSTRAGDWPQFRYDAGRTAASPHELPTDLHLSWKRVLPEPRPAFPHELRLRYDASYEPVVCGGTMFVPSMINDSVTALDTETGEQRWRFFTEGPVRFAPATANGKVYFVSDDGYLYCLNADDGVFCWKFRGLPEGKTDRKVLGHGRLISLWPARGGPVVADGVVYFAAGLWPTEGVYVHAVNAGTGRAIWSNDTAGHIPHSNWDHGIDHVSGLTPQGYLAIIGDRLVVPCGAQLPAFLDLKTGELQKYTMGWGGRLGLPKGCWFVAGTGNYLSHGGDLYDISRPSDERMPKTPPGQNDYKPLLYPGGWTRLDIERANQRELDRFRQPVMTPEVMYESDRTIVARDLTSYTMKNWTESNRPNHRVNDEIPERFSADLRQLWELASQLDVHIKVGGMLFLGGTDVVEAIDVSGEQPKSVWRAEIDGAPQRMLAADGKLFVVTTEGTILAFGATKPKEVKTHLPPMGKSNPPNIAAEKAARILNASGVRDGYALVLGIKSGRLTEALLRQSNLHVIAVDDNPALVSRVRSRLDDLGWYGSRASVLVGDPVTYPFSPYLASLVVTETPDEFPEAEYEALVRSAFHVLRPYGGVAVAWGALADSDRIKEIAESESLPSATVRASDEFVLLARPGALPGADDWSHAQANAACTGASQDEFLRAPLTLLWFDAAQRWHKYPGQNQVRVAGGRVVLFEEGVLRASDVFTGRKMWEVAVPLGARPLDDADARQTVRYSRHRQWGPKPNLAPTTELVAINDRIYLSAGRSCFVFEAAAGAQLTKIDLPEELQSPWANLRVTGDYLVGASGANVLCVDRTTGARQWRVKTARASLSLAVGDGKVFCAELVDPRRGENETSDGSLYAIDITTGNEMWRKAGGGHLRYSPAHDLVVTPTAFYRAADGEPVPRSKKVLPKRLAVYGKGLPQSGLPGYIAGDRLLTGKEDNLFVHKLPSAEPIGLPMQWARRGCTGTRASTYLLTTRFRGNSAWIDLDRRQITPLLGVRPGCGVNNNLYPANGVLNIPNLTAGCTCNYAPASVACVPARAVERNGE